MKIFFIRGAHLSGSDDLKSIMAFHEKTGKPIASIVAVAGEGNKENGLITRYKLGQIDTKNFIADMITNLDCPGLSEQDFISCWLAMCELTEAKIAQLRRVADLQQEHGFLIHVVSGTNPLQFEHLRARFAVEVPTLSFDSTLSFEHGKMGRDLINCIPESYKSMVYEYVSLLEEPNDYDLVARIEAEFKVLTPSVPLGLQGA